jgi:uncharacterized membrane protein YwaF
MKTVLAFAVFAVASVCGLQVGFKSYSAPMAQGVNAMETSELYVLIVVVLGAIVGALIFVLRAYGIALRDSLPPSFAPIVPIFLTAISDLAKRTETSADDKLIELLRELLGEPAPVVTPPPADPPAVG